MPATAQMVAYVNSAPRVFLGKLLRLRVFRLFCDGVYGQYLTYLLVALPLGWLAVSGLFGKHQGPRSQAV